MFFQAATESEEMSVDDGHESGLCEHMDWTAVANTVVTRTRLRCRYSVLMDRTVCETDICIVHLFVIFSVSSGEIAFQFLMIN